VFPGRQFLSLNRPNSRISIKAFNNEKGQRIPAENSDSYIPRQSYSEFIGSQYERVGLKLREASAQLRSRGVSVSDSSEAANVADEVVGRKRESGSASASAVTSRVVVHSGDSDSDSDSDSSSGSGRVVQVHSCSCEGAGLSVAELNSLRRAHLLNSNSVDTDNSQCEECSEFRDFTALELNGATSAAGGVVSSLLESPRSLLRPLIVTVILVALKAISAILSTLVASAVVGDFLNIFFALASDLGQIYHQAAGVGHFSLSVAYTELAEGIPVLTRTFAAGWGQLWRSLNQAWPPGGLREVFGSGLSEFLSLDVSRSWLLRVLTGRWFWQQHGLWSVVYSLPLVLDLFLAKLLGEGALALYCRLEAAVLMWLIDTESALIERSILNKDS